MVKHFLTKKLVKYGSANRDREKMTEDTSNQLVSNENKYEVLKTAHGSKSATPPKINFKLFKAVSKFRYSYVMGKVLFGLIKKLGE